MDKRYFVYVATNKNNSVLYTGVTNNLEKRMHEHVEKLTPGFTSRYNIRRLIYYDVFPTAKEAIAAEKKIKGWTRAKKLDLIRSKNPEFKDLLDENPSATAPI